MNIQVLGLGIPSRSAQPACRLGRRPRWPRCRPRPQNPARTRACSPAKASYQMLGTHVRIKAATASRQLLWVAAEGLHSGGTVGQPPGYRSPIATCRWMLVKTPADAFGMNLVTYPITYHCTHPALLYLQSEGSALQQLVPHIHTSGCGHAPGRWQHIRQQHHLVVRQVLRHLQQVHVTWAPAARPVRPARGHAVQGARAHVRATGARRCTIHAQTCAVQLEQGARTIRSSMHTLGTLRCTSYHACLHT